jgi:serine/threonine protein kinase
VDGNKINLLLDYAEKGDFYKYYKRKGKITEEEACHAMFQLSNALAYLHEKDIIHRDLKLENLLIDSDHVVKLCDFGWCSPPGDPSRNVVCGTYEYMAPEVVDRKQYGAAIDIWSFGVLCFELVHNYTPFKAPDVAGIINNIRDCRYEIDEHIIPEYRKLIKACLDINPKNRPTARELVNHEAFAKIRSVYYTRKSVRPSFDPRNPNSMTRLYQPPGETFDFRDQSTPPKQQTHLDYSHDPHQNLHLHAHSSYIPGTKPQRAQSISHLDQTLINRFGLSPQDNEQRRANKYADPFDMPEDVPDDGKPTIRSFHSLRGDFDRVENVRNIMQTCYDPHHVQDTMMHDDYQPDFEMDVNEDKFNLANMNEYIVFDVDLAGWATGIKDGGIKVAGFLGNVFSYLEDLVRGMDNDGLKSNPNNQKRNLAEANKENVYKSRLTLTPNTQKETKGLQPHEAQPIRMISSTKTPTDKTQPSDKATPEPQKKEEEVGFWQGLLTTFGFSSENDVLKKSLMEKKMQREQRRLVESSTMSQNQTISPGPRLFANNETPKKTEEKFLDSKR